MRRRVAAVTAAVLVIFGAGAAAQVSDAPPSRFAKAASLALRIDATLDQLPAPKFNSRQLATVWPVEIAPFFGYEGFTDMPTVPEVFFEVQPDGANHLHLSGYTYCDPMVFLNARYINPVSAWHSNITSLATLVHEMVHVQGGDFCSGSSASLESTTETATVEVLAAMANNGNYAALYAVLDEMRDIAMDTVLNEALKADDLDSYREFRARIFPNDPLREARFEKSMRHWDSDPVQLREILEKYSVMVFQHVTAGKITGAFPVEPGWRQTVPLDDITYLLQNLDDLAQAQPPGRRP